MDFPAIMTNPYSPNIEPRRVLVVARSLQPVANVVEPLRDAGYLVELATNRMEAIGRAATVHPDVVVIDDHFDELSSVDLTIHIRSIVQSKVPPLFIMAVDRAESEVQPLRSTPVSDPAQHPAIVWRDPAMSSTSPLANEPARDRADRRDSEATSIDSRSDPLLKKITGVLAAQTRAIAPVPRGDSIEHQGLKLDRVRHRVWTDGQPLHLTPTEFKLLWELASRPGYVLSRAALSQECRSTGSAVQTRTVDAHIKSIRRKLNHYAKLIETVHGVGYRFRETD